MFGDISPTAFSMVITRRIIDVARIFFESGASDQGAPSFGGRREPTVSKGAPSALDLGPQLAPGATAGDRGPCQFERAQLAAAGLACIPRNSPQRLHRGW